MNVTIDAAHLELERIEANLFRGIPESSDMPRVFGGQVIGQALIAALGTLDDMPPAPVAHSLQQAPQSSPQSSSQSSPQSSPQNNPCHSLHGYFLRPGDTSIPILYEVDPIRDGRSFATRRVLAVQRGEAIFNMSASFQTMEDGLSHQIAMPEVPGPDELPSAEEVFEQHRQDFPAEAVAMMERDRPIEMRWVMPLNDFHPEKREPRQQVWLRSKKNPGDALQHHQCLLAYASDMGLLSTSTLPHGMSFASGLMMASLDHAMWFHREFRVDEWVLFAMDSPAASGSRGFNRGNMFARDGTLIASVAQEGLMRVRRAPPA